jgi:1-acyl-sn-glycerol-3-phosphate acyltransferase
VKWIERFGTGRPLTAMAHPFAFIVWPLTTFMRHMGAIPSTYEAAEKALGDGVPVLVFPGGDWEASRPVWHANRVQFAGRKGFLRIARKTGVPIVPMGIRGSIYTAPMVLRSRLLSWILVIPRLLGVRVFPLSLLGVLGIALVWIFGAQLSLGWRIGLSWACAACPLSLLPWIPATIRLRLGDPIPNEVLFREGASDDEQLTEAYDRVVAAVQKLIL